MKPTIRELIAPYASVSIIGMCKNAGKTTVLNEIIRELSAAGCVMGLTSIGRDGESKDLVTGVPLFVVAGMDLRFGIGVGSLSDIFRQLHPGLLAQTQPLCSGIDLGDADPVA